MKLLSLREDYYLPAILGKSELPDKVVKGLSLDHYYGNKISNAVRRGKMDEDIAALTVGIPCWYRISTVWK